MARRPRSRSRTDRKPPIAAGAAGLPEPFRTRFRDLLGAESDAFLAALLDPPAGLRANTLRVAVDECRRLCPFPLEPLPYPPEGFLVGSGAEPGRHAYHAAGLFYLQDPGAMAVGALVDPRPGERVLDLAAAPGGKATHLAARMRGEGVLIANDPHAARARELASNLERCGVHNAVVTVESADRLAAHFDAWFDRVLLDAPCSGEAMFHKSPAARDAWSVATVAGCARRQASLLADAARLVRPGGRLVYSTCTFSPEEDEQVVAAFLAEHGGWELAALPPVPGAQPGRPDWAGAGRDLQALERTLRLWPHRAPGAGHFVAALARRDGAAPPVPQPATGEARADRSADRLWEAFRDDVLGGEPPGAGVLVARGTELFREPAGLPPLAPLRVERPGLWLGSTRGGRFQPAHALVMALRPERLRNRLLLSADDPRTAAYLRGETLAEPGPPGWMGVLVDGLPLGWAKRVGGTLKNHYPRGLRRFA